jgi:signal transduction histidine kinase
MGAFSGEGMPSDSIKPVSDIKEPPGKTTRNSIDDVITLGRLSAAISGLRDLEVILRIGLNNVLDIMDGAAGGIMLLDERSKTLSYRVYQGFSATYSKEMRVKLGEGIAGKVAQTGRAMLLEDISAEMSAVRPDLISMEGLRAFVSVPLSAKGDVLGVMNVASLVPRRFTSRDAHLLHAIGDLLGTAIEQAKLYQQLENSRERYRELARRILVAQEEERKRIARELHDETSQTLSGLALNLQALLEMADLVGIQDEQFKARLKKAHTLAIQISAEVSRLISDLRPGLLDTLGLIPAVRQYAESNLTPLGINVSFDMEKVSALPLEVEVGLFRWAQGAIGNIVQHSRARNASISLKYEGEELVLCIRDDGKGFDVSQIQGIEESGRGAGLFSMKERVRLLGGDCVVQSQPGGSTILTARVPATWREADGKNKGPGSR